MKLIFRKIGPGRIISADNQRVVEKIGFGFACYEVIKQDENGKSEGKQIGILKSYKDVFDFMRGKDVDMMKIY